MLLKICPINFFSKNLKKINMLNMKRRRAINSLQIINPMKNNSWQSILRISMVIIGLAFSVNSFATHIVGGQLTYRCLGNNNYEIKLLLYRDCYNGNPAASFDDPAPVGIYDGRTNQPVAVSGPFTINGKILIPYTGEDTIHQTLVNDCGVRNTDVCVHRTIYTDTVNLPFNPDGYIFAYQRCCRNYTVNNIVDPLETGSTYFIKLTGAAQLNCNTAANFKSWPDIYICTNSQLDFDHGAIDPDGDSLVYKLCVPSQGASLAIPNPAIPSNPPYDTVVWKSPFNLSNLMGGTTPLAIDANTGRLTAFPTIIGQYLIGVCVDEYRGGALISSTRRDFQYNVRECDLPPIAAGAVASVECGNNTVAFQDQSTGAVNFVKWIFDYPTNSDTSNLSNPSHTFSTVGNHRVALVAYRTETCNDTAFVDFTIPNSGLIPSFTNSFYRCNDTYVVSFNDTSRDTIAGSSINSWNWEFINGTDTIRASGTNTSISIPSSATRVLVRLTVGSTQGCIQTISQYIDLNNSQSITADFTYSVKKCNGVYTITPVSTSVNTIPNSTISTYEWTLLQGATVLTSNLQGPNFTVTSPNDIWLQLKVTNSLGCGNSTVRRPVDANVGDGLFPSFTRNVVRCGEKCTLSLNSTSRDSINGNAGLRQQWEIIVGTDTTRSNVVNPKVTAACGSTVTVNLTIVSVAGCMATTSETFVLEANSEVKADFNIDIRNCVQNSDVVLTATYDNNFPPTSVTWTLSNGLTGTGNTYSNALEAGAFDVTMCATFTEDCRICQVKSFTTRNLNQVSVSGGSICIGQSLVLNPSPVSPYVYTWAPGVGLSNIGSASPTAAPVVTTTYTVTVSDPVSGCKKVLNPQVVVNRSQDQLGFTFRQSCANQLSVQFTNTGVASNVTWVFGTTPPTVTTATSPVVNFPSLGNYTVIMIGGSPCVDSIVRQITLRPYQWPTLPDTVIACNTNMVNLNPGANTSFGYHWNNAALLDNADIANPKASLQSTTTFLVTITNTQENCTTTDRVVAILTQDNTVNITKDSVVCNGNVVRLIANNVNAGTYTWFNSAGVQVGTGSTLDVTVTADESYTVRVRDIYGCTHENVIRLKVQDNRVQITGNLMICPGKSTELTANVADIGNVQTYLWSPNTAIVSGQGTNKIVVNPSTSTTYNVLVTYKNGCTANAAATVSVSSFTPALSISADPDTLLQAGTVNLSVTSDPSYTYQWQPSGVLNNPNIANPIATIETSTTFTVTVTNRDGCTQVLQQFVLVRVFDCKEPFVFIPNAFSPNGDGENDYLCLRSLAVIDYDIFIYDRWGNKVFEGIRVVPSSSNTGCWNGTFDGKELSPDVYGYYLKARCVGGEQFTKQGNITLLR